jgi:hypothetical protein
MDNVLQPKCDIKDIYNIKVRHIDMEENEVNHECKRKGYIHLNEEFKYCPHCGEELYF